MKISPRVLLSEVAFASATEGAGVGVPTRSAARDVPPHPLPAHTSTCSDGFALPRGPVHRGDRSHPPPKHGDRPPLAASFPRCWMRGPARGHVPRPPARGHAGPRAVAARVGAPLATRLRRPPTGVLLPPCPADYPERAEGEQQSSGIRDGGGEETVLGAARIGVRTHDVTEVVDLIGKGGGRAGCVDCRIVTPARQIAVRTHLAGSEEIVTEDPESASPHAGADFFAPIDGFGGDLRSYL
jgi:hypothetical protein